MQNEIVFTKQEMQETLHSLSKIFDIVRLVNPVTMTVYAIDSSSGDFIAQPYSCYHVWEKGKRCENCISAKCLLNKHRYSKFEFIKDRVYHVIAQRVVVDGRELVLEIVAIVHDDILFSAFGNSKFVDIINHFNHQVYTDELTGVYNRRYLDEQFCVLSEQARQLHTSFSVVMADIDSFKSINDQYGHQEGDAILQCVAETLQSHFSKDRGDVVSRYGGDEFVVLIRGIQKPVLEERIHHLQKALSEKERPVSLSIGVFHVPLMKEKVSDKEMLKKADEALYSVKNRGKGAYCILEDK